jgi:hypothetical protein
VARLDQVRSGSVFDGMLAYALLEAYGVTGDPAHLAGARVVLDELEAIPPPSVSSMAASWRQWASPASTPAPGIRIARR